MLLISRIPNNLTSEPNTAPRFQGQILGKIQPWQGSTYTPQGVRSLEKLLLEIIRRNSRLRNPKRRETP